MVKFQITVGPVDARKLPDILNVLNEWNIPYASIEEASKTNGSDKSGYRGVPHMSPETRMRRTNKGIDVLTPGTQQHKIAVKIDKMLETQKGNMLKRSTITNNLKEYNKSNPNKVSAVISLMMRKSLLRIA